MSKKKHSSDYVNDEFTDFVNSIPPAIGMQNANKYTPPAPPAKCSNVLVKSSRREYQGIVLAHAKRGGYVDHILVRSTSYVFWNTDRWESVYDVYEVSE
jgi:hypothetical protein